ncbi:carbohydrate ABC transporter permease [Acidipropionibacterium timonense]|uniref:carbohydrate ABC transporter permease n=1 Tax=Acidipropionibacterium timonense TaxID=2161818 RepID=UPI0010325C5D|nr:sugar ABC transporter permease [Acidipropionibacterium timonense]
MVAASSSPSRSRRRRGAGHIHGSPLVALAFLTPYLAVFTIFVAVPAVYGIWISLHDWDFTLPSRPWVGLQNYADLFDSSSVQYGEFWNGMRNTGIFTVASVPFLVTLPLALALLLNLKFPGRTFFRAVFFAPYVLGVAVIGVMWRYLLNGNFGFVNYVLHTHIQWTTSQPWAWIGLVGVTVWWTLGFNAVIYMAGLANIPAEQYEAASLDGAGSWQKFRHVTLPGLRPVLVFILVTTVLASANMFGQAYTITQGGPAQSTRTAIMVITDLGFSQSRAGQAAAESYVLALFLVVISIVQFWATRDRDAAREHREQRAARRLARKEGRP